MYFLSNTKYEIKHVRESSHVHNSVIYHTIRMIRMNELILQKYVIDSERRDECIDFTMMCIFFYFFTVVTVVKIMLRK